jgi:hypothetical protein
MLEGAEAGEKLGYPLLMLPVARLAKLYSALLNAAGRVGPVPEGLSAAGALRNRQFTRTDAAIKARMMRLVEEFARTRRYMPPYWELVRLARQARLAPSRRIAALDGRPAHSGRSGLLASSVRP